MEWIGFVLIALGVVVVVGVVLVMLRRPRPPAPEPVGTPPDDERPETDVADAPAVRGVSVDGDSVVVDFDVAAPGPGEDHVAKLLARAAVEVVRRRVDLDLGSGRVTSVVARAGDATPVGQVDFADGRLPDPADIDVIVREVTGAAPLLGRADLPKPPTGPVQTGVDELAPVGAELALPDGVVAALRQSGVDPDTADATQLVEGVLRLAGFSIEPVGDNAYLAQRAGEKLLVHGVPHVAGDHPELPEAAVTRLLVGLGAHGGAKGVLVTGKIVPFHLVAKERPGVRVIGRQRLGGFIGEYTDG